MIANTRSIDGSRQRRRVDLNPAAGIPRQMATDRYESESDAGLASSIGFIG